MSGKFNLIIFFEKKISAEKNIFRKKNIFFRKKKLKKKVLLARSLAKFLNRLKVPFGKTDFGGPFLLKNREKSSCTPCFALPKIAFRATFVCSFLSPKVAAKIARRQAPVLLCEIRMQQPGYLKAPSYSVFAATRPLLLLRLLLLLLL